MRRDDYPIKLISSKVYVTRALVGTVVFVKIEVNSKVLKTILIEFANFYFVIKH